MTSDELEELRTFLRDNVSSFEELEALLFFVRSPRHPWSAADVATALNLSPDLTKEALESLAGPGRFLERTSGTGQGSVYRYLPPQDLEATVDKLQRVYQEQRLSIVQIMGSNAVERVRSSAARRLADAFRLDRSKK